MMRSANADGQPEVQSDRSRSGEYRAKHPRSIIHMSAEFGGRRSIFKRKSRTCSPEIPSLECDGRRLAAVFPEAEATG